MYTLAVEGTAVTDSATELAENYLSSAENRLEAAEALVAFESLKACGSGFACGLAGDMLLPLTVTADICSSLFIQMRMCAAVAVTGGHEVGDPIVRLLCWGAMAGDACLDSVNRIITRLLAKALDLPEAEKALLSVLHQVLISKSGGWLLKTGLLIPLLGGALNGTAAWLVTRLIGQLAIRLFLSPPNPPYTA
ncbi:TPA: hypothetical protein ONC20_004386 [Enterobacter asburiae]|uniref:hypothetical protein n=1 Tax=Enterobacter TaxID=547 RepID=UPI001A916929|nr:hypothetical protein [Enterobacter asburiae]MCM7610885.1 hypothetical protein [Enterobacter hormaechei]HED5653745.1 hypothetical protein [Citrobacter freundii]BCT20250.1 hypothetical protein R2TS_34220 [Enterobacter asburiae]HCR1902113.1 hypothetical protein [Enterobacter asburiae]HDX3906549.1 hypothetical protein [Enterobacter asburiae]